MRRPTKNDVKVLRESLEEMIQEEIDLEACGDNGHWDVETQDHIIMARQALADTNDVIYEGGK